MRVAAGFHVVITASGVVVRIASSADDTSAVKRSRLSGVGGPGNGGEAVTVGSCRRCPASPAAHG
jgi:hypothetical protein